MNPFPISKSLTSAALALCCAASLAAQRGTYTGPHGTGCSGPAGVPVIFNTSVPEIGRTMQLLVQRAGAGSLCFLFFGWSDTQWGATPLPMSLGGGCTLYVSPDVTLGMIADANGTATHNWNIPAVPSLIGFRYHNQFAVQNRASPGGLAWSPKGTGVIGAPTPTAPSALRALEIRLGSVTLGWSDRSGDETGFRVFSSTNGQSFSRVTDLPRNSTQYQVSGLQPCQPYWFRVEALGSYGGSGPSNTVQATPTPLVPAPPSNLRATDINARTATIQWADNNPTELGFEVFVSTDGVNYGLLATPGPDSTSLRVTGMGPRTPHWFKVRVIRQCGVVSSFSNVLHFTTADVAPAAPSALQATAVRNRQVDLLWNDNSDNETLFRVRFSTDGNNFNHVADLPANSRNFTVTGLNRSTTYWFKVVARNAVGPSPDSNVIRIRTN